MNLNQMRETAPRVSELMKVLSNEHRLMILCQLAEGEKSVGELAELLNVRQAALSQQLALLRKDGMVNTRRQAQNVFYSLAREDVRSLMGFLYETYCGIDKKRDDDAA
jgi:DNA-binding transcriptional ArsR family regulator